MARQVTEDEHKRMEETHKMCREMHAYFFDGEPNRAKRLDTILTAVSAGRFGARVIMWTAAAVVAIAAAWGELKGWFAR